MGFLMAALLAPLTVGLRTLIFPTTLTAGQYDCAIVLGAAVSDSRPSPVFRARLDHGVTLYQKNIVEKLIFTGGIGAGDTQAESAVGADRKSVV